MTYVPQLYDRWYDLWTRLGNPDRTSPTQFYRDLDRKYRQPHRAYHTDAHLKHCMAELDEVRGLAEDPNEIEFALWYHDYIYETRPNRVVSNERHSALIAQFVMGILPLKVGDSFSQRVVEDILATEHNGVAERPDTLLLVDIDLAILGQPQDRFDEYEREIRFEYSWVVDDAFRKGRSTILQQFLDRPNIYYTPYFQGKYGEQARQNLLRSLEQLQD